MYAYANFVYHISYDHGMHLDYLGCGYYHTTYTLNPSSCLNAFTYILFRHINNKDFRVSNIMLK